ncbi:MAG: TolB family protein [Spirochaetia bacterium]
MKKKKNYKKLSVYVLVAAAAIIVLALTACDPSVTVNRQPALSDIVGIWDLESIQPEQDYHEVLEIKSDGTGVIWRDEQGLSFVMEVTDEGGGTFGFTHELAPINPELTGFSFKGNFTVRDGKLYAHYYALGTEETQDIVYAPLETLPVSEWSTDFESGLSDFITTGTVSGEPEWQIIDDGANKVYAPVKSDGNSDADINIYAGKNYTLEYRIKRKKSETVDEKCWTVLDFNKSASDGNQSAFWLNSHQNGSWYFGDRGDELEDLSYTTLMKWDTWHTMKVTVREGKYFQFFLDGELFGEREVAEVWHAGFKIEGNPANGLWYIDDISITWNQYTETEAVDYDLLTGLVCRSGEIVLFDPEGTAAYQITHDDYSKARPRWIPGTEKILFSQTIDGNSDIYTMNRDGSDVIRLTSDPNDDTAASPSPDGTKIVFESNRDADSADPDLGDIFIMNSDGTGITNLTGSPGHDDQLPNFSPDGNKIVYSSGEQSSNGAWRIHLMDIDGTNSTPVTPDSTQTDPPTPDCSSPRMSPDGTYVVYHTQNWEDTDIIPAIYRVKSDGSEDPELLYLDDVLAAWDPLYNSDGTKIYFTLGGKLMVMDSDGSNPAEILPKPGTNDWFYHPDIK